MNLKRRTLTYLALSLFISVCLTSCTPAAEINVACDDFELIKAINRANVYPDTTRLILEPDCTYPIKSQDNTYGGHGGNGLPVVTTKIVIEGNNASLVRSPGSPNFRFFFITDSGNLRLEDITLEDGSPFRYTDERPNCRGGAIFNDGGGLRAERSQFLSNSATWGEGGAIYNLGVLTLEESTFENNLSNTGGAIYNGGATNIAAVLQDVIFEENNANFNGGAIYNASPEAGLMIVGSTFDSNHSHENGGAIYMEAGDLDISNSEFLKNKAGLISNPSGDGGAIYSQAGDVTIIATHFNQHTAYGNGGILYAGPGSDVRLREVRSEESKACRGGGALYVEGETEVLQTTFKSNLGGGWDYGWLSSSPYYEVCFDYHGGAIYNTGILAIESSLFDDSYAHGDGDGIYNLGVLSIINSTFNEENYTWPRESIYNLGNAQVIFSTLMNAGPTNYGTMNVKNIVVAGTSGGCINSGTFVEWGENIAIDPNCPFSNIFTNTNDLGIDTSLSDNGGPTLTHHVADDSPLVDQVRCLTISGDQVINDQRGVYRPHPLSGDIYSCDIGAYEVHYLSDPLNPTPPLDTDPEPSSSCDPFEGEEISLMMQSLPANTRIQVMYIKVEDGKIPGFDTEELNGEPPYQYEAYLGTIPSYICGLQGFPDRLYCLFHIPEGMEGTAQLFELWLNDCPDFVYNQPNVLIPMTFPASSDPPGPSGPVCTVDLISPDCEAAGGHMSSGATSAPKCVCP